MPNPMQGTDAFALLLALSACGFDEKETAGGSDEGDRCNGVEPAIVAVPAGSFVMGSNAVYRQEGPPRTTRIDRFRIDRTEVSNAQFARFVEATGYRTVAERAVDPSSFGAPEENIPPDLLQPGSAVFAVGEGRGQGGTWTYVRGAYWRKPGGPEAAAARPEHPVVHLAYEDMVAYAQWAGGRLPTEAEWEYAASANAADSIAQPSPDRANSWQGVFPYLDQGTDGYRGTAPVGCYEPNGFGLYDTVGNVWEITADYYRDGHDPDADDNPSGPTIGELRNSRLATSAGAPHERVMKGGSYLCAPNYCQRYRPEARHARDPGLGASNVGFRVAYDDPASAKQAD